MLELHLAQITAFQYEPLIHLIITLFFAGLFLTIFLYGLIWMLWQFWVLVFILMILLGFYFKHYFVLENTIQKLYTFTEQLFKLLEPTLQKQ